MTQNDNEKIQIEPSVLTFEEIEKVYKTSIGKGLTHTEARRRASNARKALFAPRSVSAVEIFISSLSDPTQLITLALSLIAVIFGRADVGAIALIFLFLQAALVFFLNRRAGLATSSTSRFDAPMPRVMRSGKVYRITENELVVGDIIMLFEGDIVAADARIVYAEGLVVEEYIADNENPLLMYKTDRVLKKEEVQINTLHSSENTVYAGDIIRGGACLAVVYAVGLDTHTGAKSGSVLPMHKDMPTDTEKAVKKAYTAYLPVALIAVIVLFALSVVMFSLRKSGTDLLDIALAWLLLGASASLPVLASWIKLPATVAKVRMSREKGSDRAIVKSQNSLDTIAEMTHFIFMGESAFHDGIPHPEWLIAVNENGSVEKTDVSRGEISEGARRIAERLHIMSAYIENYDIALDADGVFKLTELLDKAVMTDFDAYGLSIEGCTLSSDGFSLTVKYKGEEARCETLTLVNDINFMSACRNMLAEDASDIVRAVDDAREHGTEVFYLLGGDSGDVLLGAVAYSSHTSEKIAGAVLSLKNMGIDVTVCDTQNSAQLRRALSGCGIEEGNIHIGITPSQIYDMVRQMKEGGAVVGIASHELSSLPVLNLADVAFAYAADLDTEIRKRVISHREEAEQYSDDKRNSPRSCDLVLRRADVVVRRASATGGGAVTVAAAVRRACEYKRKSDVIVTYMAISFTLRLVLCMFSAFLLADVPSVLFMCTSGILIDSLACFALSMSNAKASNTRMADTFKPSEDILKKPFICALASLLPSAVALTVLALLGIVTVGGGTAALCLSTLLTQLLWYSFGIGYKADKKESVKLVRAFGKHSNRAASFAVLAMGIATIAFAVYAAVVSRSLLCMLISLAQPIIFALLFRLLPDMDKSARRY